MGLPRGHAGMKCGEPATDTDQKPWKPEQWGNAIDRRYGEPPRVWEDWTRKAQAGLLGALGEDDTQAVMLRGGGGPLCCSDHNPHARWNVKAKHVGGFG